MFEPFRIACVQNRATDDTGRSVSECTRLIHDANAQGADVICLPEFCAHLHVEGKTFDTGAAPEDRHRGLAELRSLAGSLKKWLLVGSIAVIDETGQQRNRCLLIDPTGDIAVRYDKIHMFDVDLGNGEAYRESDSFGAGDSVVVVDTPFARLGLSVCYDLRFAALYRRLAHNGATVLTVPAAFTYTTGKAHWHVLLRARAIETGSYVVAPCQYGYHGKARTYGHSLIISPWGEILAEGSEDTADVVTAEIDPQAVIDARSKIPALEHDRPLNLAMSQPPSITRRA